MHNESSSLDTEFAVRYLGLVDIIKSWTEQYLRFDEIDILDFGCGEAITALGFAHRVKARSVSAVDIMPDVLRCAARAKSNLGIEELPPNLHTRQIKPAEDFLPGRKFDLIYSWSVFEHIDQPIIDGVFEQIKSRLKPGGLLFTQIAPLYFSADGAHLSHRIPIPWGHLLTQDSLYYAKLSEACADIAERDALWACYSTLNKLTATELKRRLARTDLELIREYTTVDENAGDPSRELLEIYTRDVLTTNQIVLLYRNNESA